MSTLAITAALGYIAVTLIFFDHLDRSTPETSRLKRWHERYVMDPMRFVTHWSGLAWLVARAEGRR